MWTGNISSFKFIPDMETTYWNKKSVEENVSNRTWLCGASKQWWQTEGNIIIHSNHCWMPFHLSPRFYAAQRVWLKKKPFVAQDCLLVQHRDLLPPYLNSQLTSSSQLMKPELRRDTQMLHPGFITCWKRPHFHWAVFEGGLACVLSWDGSVFVLLNSLTPSGPVSSSLTTAAPWVREWREAEERRWAEPDPPVGSLLYCFKRCCLFILKRDG